MMSDVAAVVLCGGESRRMGRPKAWLDFGHETLLQRVVRLVSVVGGPVVVVAAPGQDLPPLPPSVRFARDAVARRGPLEGLLAGLKTLSRESRFAYVTATDVPFLNPTWITFLREVVGDDDLAIARLDGRYHPLAALYRVSAVLPVVERRLAAEQLRLLDLIESLKTRVIHDAELARVDPEGRTLQNLNTPDDYERALAEAGFKTA
ncbi:MAG TPA: molybdenum cofactor guanylyltransferase [Pirellulales bacterium]|nr:molybdenum cofactor guanylyltransferase [Pirellulales bacterium]